jgi:hypothetical protein
MRRIACAALAVALGLTGVGCDDATEGVELFRATLSSANEVPPNPSAATGSAGFQVEGDVVSFSVEAHGISNVTGAHIHSGAAGVNGSIRAFLFPGGVAFTTTPVPSVNGILMQGSFTSSQVTGITYAQLLSEMRAGTAYVNVHTTARPGGEIRGQVQTVALD